MAVEKMELMGAVGCIDDIDLISEEMVKCGCIHPVNALDEINQITEAIGEEERSFIKQYENPYSRNIKDNIEKVIDILGIKPIDYEKYMGENMAIDEIYNLIAPISESAVGCSKKIEKLNDEIDDLSDIMVNLRDISDLTFPLSDIKGLKHFKMAIGRLNRNSYRKLMDNIGNIPSIVYRLSKRKKCVTIISFTPVYKISDAYEIFRSLGFEEIVIPDVIGGAPSEIIYDLGKIIEQKRQIIKETKESIESLSLKYSEVIKKCYSLALKYEMMDYLNRGAVSTKHLFYICGWIPLSDKSDMETEMKTVEDHLVMTSIDDSDVKGITPPTKLVNNKIIKPFEYLVNMYGTPTYGEVDPTLFVAISYMLLFGAMFGDVGQGFLLLLGGLYLLFVSRSYSFGGILSSVGISSMIFGFFYGSVFGIETIIKPLIIKPIENINTMLMSGIVFGILLLSTGYILNLVNSFNDKNIEEGIFGREGAAGFLLYIVLLVSGVWFYINSNLPLPPVIVLIVIVILLLLMVIKQPLSRIIEGKRPLYDESAGNYYIESIFGMVETLLSILSNTISFVRVGAFALNHVGLFIAFSTVSSMISSRAGSVAVMVIGNIIIIALEGLVVLIQCLRLEYYEIFSKFYEGNGEQYNPVCTFNKLK